MLSKSIGSLSLVWLLMAISATAQSPAVLDADGQPLRNGVEYYVLPAATDTAGGLTLINHTGSCPFYVGQEPLSTVVSQGLPVIFRPADGDEIVREGMPMGISFSAATTCVQSTAWRIGDSTDPESDPSRKFIVTGEGENFFRIGNDGGLYNLIWCAGCDTPTCPRIACLRADVLVRNGNRLLTLDLGSSFPFQFKRAN